MFKKKTTRRSKSYKEAKMKNQEVVIHIEFRKLQHTSIQKEHLPKVTKTQLTVKDDLESSDSQKENLILITKKKN
ncbi:24910_t:CDS:2 [Cetraspora pellucida]|uniref:24910_t:CDS:1 n=1 Tax=Cetraspora pellucida TaxID=1433469 RepID=A0A9N9DXS3_9GLOM|nr:24910_t:CDS:2 [Cetraspora pellucida]